MKQPLISIIVPLYNAEKTIERCLASLQNQSYYNIEIIMVNDGSNDNSETICKKYADIDGRFKLINQTNKGVSCARNVGLSVAEGQYIGFCDADDYAEPEMYEMLLKSLVSCNAQISVVDVILEDFKDNKIKFIDSDDFEIFERTNALIEICRGGKFEGQLWNKLFDRSIINKLSFDEDITINEDLLFLCKAICRIDKLVFLHKHLYHYVNVLDSATHSAFKKSDWSARTACIRLYKILSPEAPICEKYCAKLIIWNDIKIARKLLEQGKLDDNTYSFIRKDIISYINHEVFKIMKKNQRVFALSIICGRWLFSFIELIGKRIKHS